MTGVTTMLLEEGLDTGPMLLRRELPIGPDATSVDLFSTLAPIGAELMVETLRRLEEGSITPERQDDTKATLAPILTRDDARIDFTRSAQEIYNRYRGFQPWPGAWTTLRGKKLIVHRMHLAGARSAAQPGTVLVSEDHLSVAASDGNVLVLDEVQMEGKKRMPADEFLHGHQVKTGEALG